MNRPAFVAALMLAAVPLGAATAQTSVTRSATAQTGKVVRLVIAPNLKKDCSLGTVPEVRVTTPPKNGSLITRVSKAKTPANYRCPNIEASVQGVFYQSNPRYVGTDEVVVAMKTADGQDETITVKITVGSGSPATEKKSGTDL